MLKEKNVAMCGKNTSNIRIKQVLVNIKVKIFWTVAYH